MGIFDFLTKPDKSKLEQGLEKTKKGFFAKVSHAIAGKSIVDDSLLDDIEEAMISADVGLETTVKIIKRLEARVARDKYINAGDLMSILKEEIRAMLAENQSQDQQAWVETSGKPYVIMVVGVNGVGKTTTIGKLAYRMREAGHQVLLGAGDTFRAAAIDQLKVWADRAGVDIISKEMGSDPAAVAFETVKLGKDRDVDVVMVDTAGRLHNKVNLMNELSKVHRVMEKVIPDAPHEVLLVLDASTGQNAVQQAKQFLSATHVTALALTKLDGTAKGGVVLAIADQFQIPIKYIGVGEGVEHLQLFNRETFIDALFDN